MRTRGERTRHGPGAAIHASSTAARSEDHAGCQNRQHEDLRIHSSFYTRLAGGTSVGEVSDISAQTWMFFQNFVLAKMQRSRKPPRMAVFERLR
jgi:hypothetical protein